MLPRGIAGTLLIVAAWFAATPAIADSEATRAAELAVRNAVYDRIGRGNRVAFEPSTEKILSPNEVVVTGSGHVYEGRKWESDKSFTFFVKVKKDGSSTRDLQISFSDGAKHSGNSGWQDVRYSDNYIRLNRPSRNEHFGSGAVTFEGRAPRGVTIEVRDLDSGKVVSTFAASIDGRFQTVIQLPTGRYHAAVTDVRNPSESDEVKFSVSAAGGREDIPGGRLTIERPLSNVTVRGPSVNFAGRSRAQSVRVEVLDSTNNRVAVRELSTRNGIWNTDFNLSNGSYRMTVQDLQGRNEETRNFRVGESDWRGSGNVTIERPSRNATVRGPSVNFAGRGEDGSVRVEVWDSGYNRVAVRELRIQDHRWSTDFSLSEGSYRVRVQDLQGPGEDTRNFRVRGRD